MADRHQAQAYPLRLPDDLKAQVTEAAKANGRSLNAEIVVRLGESLDGKAVHIPDDIRGELLKRADDNGWPFESELVHTLVDALSSRDPSEDGEAWQLRLADVAEDARVKLFLKDALINDLIRDGVNLRHNLLHLAILIEHASGMTDDQFLLRRMQSLAETARERASFQYIGDFDDRAAMSPELVVVLREALKNMERGLARTRAFFAADSEKLELLLKEVDLPTVEQLEAIKKVDLQDAMKDPGFGVARKPVPPTAEDLRRELNDPESVRASTRQVVNESFNAGHEPTPAASDPPAQPANERAVKPKPRLQRLVTKTAKKRAK